MSTVRQALVEVALEKGLRQSTVVSYDIADSAGGDRCRGGALMDREGVIKRLRAIDTPNTRRAAVIRVARPEGPEAHGSIGTSVGALAGWAQFRYPG